MSPVFAQGFIDVEIVGGSRRPAVRKKDLIEILQKHVLPANNDDVTLRCSHNGTECALKASWNDKKSNGQQNAVGLIQVYLDKTARMRKRVALVMYSAHDV